MPQPRSQKLPVTKGSLMTEAIDAGENTVKDSMDIADGAEAHRQLVLMLPSMTQLIKTPKTHHRRPSLPSRMGNWRMIREHRKRRRQRRTTEGSGRGTGMETGTETRIGTGRRTEKTAIGTVMTRTHAGTGMSEGGQATRTRTGTGTGTEKGTQAAGEGERGQARGIETGTGTEARIMTDLRATERRSGHPDTAHAPRTVQGGTARGTCFMPARTLGCLVLKLSFCQSVHPKVLWSSAGERCPQRKEHGCL